MEKTTKSVHDESVAPTPHTVCNTIGMGQFGIVYESVLPSYGVVAIKRTLITSMPEYERIMRERHHLETLKHPRIAKLLETWVVPSVNVAERKTIWLVMEHAGRDSLFDWFQSNGVVEFKKRATILFDIVDAISYIHAKGLVHGDIKLENITIKSGQIKVVDLGYMQEESELSREKPMGGTLAYCAPEVLMHIGFGKQSADVWSLGVVIYSLAIGSFPVTHASYDHSLYCAAANSQRFYGHCPLTSFTSLHNLETSTIHACDRELINASLCVDESKRLPSYKLRKIALRYAQEIYRGD